MSRLISGIKQLRTRLYNKYFDLFGDVHLCSLTEMYLTLFTFTEISDAMIIINKTDLFSWHYDSQLKS